MNLSWRSTTDGVKRKLFYMYTCELIAPERENMKSNLSIIFLFNLSLKSPVALSLGTTSYWFESAEGRQFKKLSIKRNAPSLKQTVPNLSSAGKVAVWITSWSWRNSRVKGGTSDIHWQHRGGSFHAALFHISKKPATRQRSERPKEDRGLAIVWRHLWPTCCVQCVATTLLFSSLKINYEHCGRPTYSCFESRPCITRNLLQQRKIAYLFWKLLSGFEVSLLSLVCAFWWIDCASVGAVWVPDKANCLA